MKVVSAQQMRNIDKHTIEIIGIPGIVLMENAGRAVVEKMAQEFQDLKNLKVNVVCGKGNNGGDGLVVARTLYNRGIEVKTFLLSDPSSLTKEAKTNFDIALKIGLKTTIINNANSFENAKSSLSRCDLIVDAIFGTGIIPPVTGFIGEVIKFINTIGCPIISVDIPSGMSADSPQLCGDFIKATATITFGFPKIGPSLYPASSFSGVTHVVDIGIPKISTPAKEIKNEIIEDSLIRKSFKTRKRDAHKGDFGHICIIAGSQGKAGAAILCSMAALKAGAGLVTLCLPKSLQNYVDTQFPEIMTEGLPETLNGTLSDKSYSRIMEIIKTKNVVIIGPGISLHEKTANLVKSLVEEITLPMVLDADALTIISKNTKILHKNSKPIILTPHPGEFSRLIKKDIKEIMEDRIQWVRFAVESFNCVLILKGYNTLIGTPDGKIYINRTGNPGMATGGSGDILTGIIGSFIGQGFSIRDAAIAGVYTHGMAGDNAAYIKGEMGLIASDIISFLPETINLFYKKPSKKHEIQC